jgi:hypothetical protein
VRRRWTRRAGLAIRAAHALCGPDARRLRAPDAAQGSFGEPAGLIAWVVCISAGLLFARQAIATARSVAVQTGLATRSAEARFNALDPQYRRRDRDRDPGRDRQLCDSDGERIFGFQRRISSASISTTRRLRRPCAAREFLAHDLAQAGASLRSRYACRAATTASAWSKSMAPTWKDERAIGGRLLNLRDTTDRKGMEEQLKRMALHDPLTLLANRSLFRDRVEHAVAVSKRNGRSVA